VVFADPPYNLGWGKSLPGLIAQNWDIVSPGGAFVFERSSRETPVEIVVPRDDRVYGETVLSFYWKREVSDI
jgi:16S rRNA G966 N2-methylase RsmD